MGLLAGKIILVTHVRHFVGQATARACHDEGATVICHDESFVDMAEKEGFEDASPGLIACRAQKPEELLSDILGRHKTLDILISNDAFPAIRAPVEEADSADLRQTMEALVVRPFNLAGHVAGQMRAQGGGRMIFMTSAAPLRGLSNYSIYATARGAANAMVLSLAKELASSGILVNAIAPNYVESPTYFPDRLRDDPEILAKITKNIPLNRLGKPEEVAAMAVFLASARCGFVTGHIMPVAGGWV